jgi:hypothetical protein
LSLLCSSNELERKLFTGRAKLLQLGDDLSCTSQPILSVVREYRRDIETSITGQRGSCQIPLSAGDLGLLGGAQCRLIDGQLTLRRLVLCRSGLHDVGGQLTLRFHR